MSPEVKTKADGAINERGGNADIADKTRLLEGEDGKQLLIAELAEGDEAVGWMGNLPAIR